MRTRGLVGALAAAGALAAPATAHAGYVAAYENVGPGRGFDVQLIDAATGTPIPVPAGVNTTADEYHPTLSADGKLLVFERTLLQLSLDGVVSRPGPRTVHQVDLRTGALTTIEHGAGPDRGTPSFDGATPGVAMGIGATDQASMAQSGIRVHFPPVGNTIVQAPFDLGVHYSGTNSSPPSFEVANPSIAPGAIGATVIRTFASSPNLRPATVFVGARPSAGAGDPFLQTPGLRVSVRQSDGFATIEQSVGGLRTAERPWTNLSDAPVAISDSTTLGVETMPAWSPDGRALGFVRTTAAARVLLVYSLEPGVQGFLNPAVAIGNLPDNPSVLEFQKRYGNLSIAPDVRPLPGSPASGPLPPLSPVTCTVACQTAVAKGVLKPRVVVPGKVGILVARVVGQHKVLGLTLPRIERVGRVPLGVQKAGTRRIAWDGKVHGRKLRAGRYLITFRGLGANGRILGVSASAGLRVRGATER